MNSSCFPWERFMAIYHQAEYEVFIWYTREYLTACQRYVFALLVPSC